MNAVQRFGTHTFSSLAVRNFRVYLAGQGVSLCGTWAQTIGQGLLVLHLTGSGAALGFVTALQTLPILFLAPWGGVVADRYPKRSILYVTQTISAALAFGLGFLVATGRVEVWMVYAMACGLGAVNAIDNPTRQSFVHEMVGPDRLANAVSLNSTEINLARVVGPAIAGLLASTVGLAGCFLVNGCSFLAVLLALAMMRGGELRPAPRIPRAKGQIRAVLAYVASSPVLLGTLLMMAIVGTFTYEFTVSLPLFAQVTAPDPAVGYAALTAAMGAGAVVGGLVAANRQVDSPAQFVVSALLFGGAVLATAAARTLAAAMVALVFVGFFSITFSLLGNVALQMGSVPEMRGRVMGLWTMAFLGSTPVGAPLVGAIGEFAGPRWGLAVGGVAAVAAAALGWFVMRTRMRPIRRSLPPPPPGAGRGPREGGSMPTPPP